MKDDDVKISRKKPVFPVGLGLEKYLKAYQRESKLPISYFDLLDFHETIPSLDKNGEDTLWEVPLYPPHLQDQIYDVIAR